MNYIQIEKIITNNGWVLVRTIGSSRQYRKSGCETPVILTMYSSRNVSADVLKILEKKTGLSLKG